MFPHFNQNNKKRNNYEIRSLEQIKEAEHKKPKEVKLDFSRKQIEEKSKAEGEQHEEEKQRLVLLKKRVPFGDRTNKVSSDTFYKELHDQSKIERSEKTLPDQTKDGKGQREQLRKQEQERERDLQSRRKKELGNDVNRNLKNDLSHISQYMPLQELNKISMADHSMAERGVDPKKFRLVSQELSNALENSSPDQLLISKNRKEFREMAKKLGLIRPEV